MDRVSQEEHNHLKEVNLLLHLFRNDIERTLKKSQMKVEAGLIHWQESRSLADLHCKNNSRKPLDEIWVSSDPLLIRLRHWVLACHQRKWMSGGVIPAWLSLGTSWTGWVKVSIPAGPLLLSWRTSLANGSRRLHCLSSHSVCLGWTRPWSM